ncbi:MAG: aminoacyl-tRNA hydrolase [Paracoccaceae bacterium]
MRLFVGLGNPGAKFAGNRHNIGFMAIDRIAADHGFAPFRAKFQGQFAEGLLGGQKIMLLKPETFMNLSGQAVRAAADFYRLKPTDILVFHDELDLAPGKCRAKTGGGHAGHNGLRSLHAHLGDGYHRIRLGIGHPGAKELVSPFVLSDFRKEDAGWLDDLLRGLSDAAPAMARDDMAGAMNAVALRTTPQRNAAPAKGGASAAASAPTSPTTEAKAKVPDEQGLSLLQRLAERFRK